MKQCIKSDRLSQHVRFFFLKLHVLPLLRNNDVIDAPSSSPGGTNKKIGDSGRTQNLGHLGVQQLNPSDQFSFGTESAECGSGGTKLTL